MLFNKAAIVSLLVAGASANGLLFRREDIINLDNDELPNACVEYGEIIHQCSNMDFDDFTASPNIEDRCKIFSKKECENFVERSKIGMYNCHMALVNEEYKKTNKDYEKEIAEMADNFEEEMRKLMKQYKLFCTIDPETNKYCTFATKLIENAEEIDDMKNPDEFLFNIFAESCTSKTCAKAGSEMLTLALEDTYRSDSDYDFIKEIRDSLESEKCKLHEIPDFSSINFKRPSYDDKESDEESENNETLNDDIDSNDEAEVQTETDKTESKAKEQTKPKRKCIVKKN